MNKFTLVIVSMALINILYACSNNVSIKDDSSSDGYLESDLPACDQILIEGIDPCERRDHIALPESAPQSISIDDTPPSIADTLNFKTYSTYGEAAPHMVIRGIPLPGTARCASWSMVLPSFLPQSDIESVSNLLRHLMCHIDVQVNEYIVGNGPSSITAVFSAMPYSAEYHDVLSQDVWDEITRYNQDDVTDSFEAREWMIWIGPSYTTSLEGWAVYERWDVQRRSDGTIVAVSPSKQHYEPTPDNLARLEMPLEEFRKQIVAAHEARVAETGGRIGTDDSSGRTKRSADDPPLPPLITDANDLHSYYRNELRAYDNLTATPQPPPPVPDQ